MLRDAIETLVNLGKKATEARIVHLPGGEQFLIDQAGERELMEIKPPRRSHTVLTLADLAAWATVDSPGNGSEVAKRRRLVVATAPVIYHQDDEVVLLLNDADRRDRVRMPLELASTFMVLQRLTAPPHHLFHPKELATLLRVELAGTVYSDELVKALRKLKWKSTQETRQSFEHGRESLGRDVEAEVQADVELPEFVEIESPVYANPGEERTHPVRCVLDPQPLLQKIAFRPVPGEIEEALKQAQGGIRSRLEQWLPTVPIFYGTP